ncbi:hypothetical protein [Flagellimonas pacifica]|uniref:Uncharacterized protein n=1 Tax=Flagellimonas pacifica TaxID=1247520 RepID=A0A285MSZ6_9FLAO|nr:hypothetical protein [Allomuricauda parva]SNY99803.1 hypothetical protein SAMN06265377_1617 [Allomuricauda parva]
MGGAGHMLHTIKSLKANRDLLKKRKRKSKEDVYGVETRTELNLKKSTLKDIMNIRREIAEQKRKNKVAGLLAILIMAMLAVIGYWLFQ